MKRKILRYIVTILFSVIVALSISSGKIYGADEKSSAEKQAEKQVEQELKDEYSLKGLRDKMNGTKALNDKIEEGKEKGNKEYKDAKKAEKTKTAKNKSYATVLFKDSKKNQKLMYYNKQTGTKAPTVQSKIKDNTHNEDEAIKYASFLNSLDAWNLYNVSSTQQDSITNLFIAFIKGCYGTVLLACFKLLTGLEALKNLFADMMDQLNVFKYITEGGSFPKDSPFYFLNWVLNIYHKLTTLAKVLLACFMGWIAFMLASGAGKARNRGSYAKNNGLKVIYAIVAMVIAAVFASLSITVATDMLRNSDGASTDAVEKIPRGMIVDSRQYIDNSLTDIKGKKGAEGTNDGYVLNHAEGFPTTPEKVNNDLPTKKLVNYMNTNNDDELAEKLDGGTLLYNWAYSVNLNANDISTMYELSQKNGEKNNQNYLAFKLAPQTDGVKLTGGKEFFSTELKDAEVSSSSLAGNTGLGVFLNGLKMGAIILTITGIILTLYFAIFVGFINAIKDFFINVSFSQMGMYQAFFGVFITGAMLILGIQLTLFLMQIVPDAILAVDESFTNQLNNYDKFDGSVKQLLQTVVTILALWLIVGLVWKVKKGVMKLVSEFFNRILDGMNPEGSIAGGSRADKRALENALNSNLAGQELSEGIANDPYGAAKNGIGSTVGGIKKGYKSLKDMQSKDDKEEQSVMSLMKNDEENANGLNDEKSSEFSGTASSTSDDSDDVDANSEELERDINEGIQNLEDTSEQGVYRNLNERDESIANATNEFEQLNENQQELQSAKEDLANLKASGAPEEEIAAAEQRVTNAEQAYDTQLGKSQEAQRMLSRSGAGIEDIGASKAQAMQDYHEASDEIESAEQKVVDLTSEREEMEALGASQPQLAQADNKLNKAKDELLIGKEKQKLAQQAYESNVINPTAEKEARTSLVEAQDGQITAERELEQASSNGNLTTEEHTTLQNAASSLGGEVHTMKEQIDEQVRSGEAKQTAIQHMKENNGNAFSPNDIAIQQKELQNAEQKVANIQTQYEKAQMNPSNNSQRMEMLNNELSNAKANHSNLQVASQAINKGENVGGAIQAQQQVMTQAYDKKVQAEKALEKLEIQDKSGATTDRSEMKQAVAQVKQTQAAYSNAGRVMSGLYATNSVGATKVPEVKLQELESDNSNSLNGFYEQQKDVGGVQNTIGKLEKGGHADIKETHAISQFQKQARRKASEKVKRANDRYRDLQQKIAKMKKLEQNGVHVKPQVERYQSSLRQTKSDLDNAKQQEEHLTTQGFSINSVGNTMKNNYSSSKDKVKEMSELVGERKKSHQNILKTGGLSKDQLDKYKEQLSDEREKSQSDMEQFSRERESKVASIKKGFEV